MAEDSAARFRASLDKLLYYDKDSGTAPKEVSPDAFGGIGAGNNEVSEKPSNPGDTRDVHQRRHEARPSDRRDYLRRVATFRPAVWFAKPEGLKPVDCARRGWTCAGVDLLECEACKARLLFAVPPTASSNDAKSLAARTAPRLDENHELSCGWRGTQCPASVARFPRVPDETLRDEFRERRDALLELEHVPEVFAIVSAEESSAMTASDRFATAAVANRLARLAQSALSVGTELSTAASREISPARLRAATALALCGWTVGNKQASSETKVDATLLASPAWSPSPRRGARRLSLDGKVTGSILRCALCDAKAATWNFADVRETSSSARPFGTAAGAGSSPYQKKKPVASATALMGAMGGAFGPSVFDAAPPEPNPAGPGPGPGSGGPAGAPAPAAASETNGNGNPPVMSLRLSIAGGGTPSRAAFGAGPFGNAAASPPAFGAGAARGAPFGAPGGLSPSPAPPASAKRKRDDSSSEGDVLLGTAAKTPVRMPVLTPLPPQSPAASASVPEVPGAFHPLTRHRAHCPWSAPFMSGSEGDGLFPRVAAQPGWQCVLDAVAPFESADADADDGAGRLATPADQDDRNDAPREKGPPGRLEEYSGLSGRNAVASYLAGGA